MGNDNEFPKYNSTAKAAEFLGHPYFYSGDADLAKLLAPIRELKFGDQTFEEALYYLNMGLPQLDHSAKAIDFFSQSYFYRGNYRMEELYKPIRKEKYGSKTVGEVLKMLLTEQEYFDFFVSVGVPREAVCQYRQVPSADNLRYVPTVNGDEKAKEFFSHPLFYYGNEYAADLYADIRNHLFGEKSIHEVTQPCRSYRDLEKIFISVGIHRGIQIIQYHPAYAYVFSAPFFSENNPENNESED
jgi:hypothetical protein